MNERTDIRQHGDAAPFEAVFRKNGEVLAGHMSTITPMTATEIAAVTGLPVRGILQTVSAMVRDGKADFVSPELGWVLI